MKLKDLKKNEIINAGNDSLEIYNLIAFDNVKEKANKFADTIELHFKDLVEILLEYESFEVVQDEISRTIDLLRNLDENTDFFALRIGLTVSFLPRNQPIYAFTCFVVIPALMSSEAVFRIPSSMKNFFPRMMQLLDIDKLFPNIKVSPLQRLDFLIEYSALLVNSKTGESKPKTDAVIFTGTSLHAEQLRSVFDKRTLFIANGSGHNPVVVAEDADLEKALEAVLTLQFYNQGQDCAAPNSILIHTAILEKFLSLLRNSIKTLLIGKYSDRSCRVGPISDPNDLERIQKFFLDNREWLDYSTPGIINTSESLVNPTIIVKPLSLGGNFNEIFAPVVFVQEFKNDSDLSLYFEDIKYATNAMYVTVYGTSCYIENMIGKVVNGKVLHGVETYLHNKHLHEPGVERGTQPYGGYGVGSSNFSINGKVLSIPTLPQREIYEQIVHPLLSGVKKIDELKKDFIQFDGIQRKDVSKILRFKHNEAPTQGEVFFTDEMYLDLSPLKVMKAHYVKIKRTHVHKLLENLNIEYVSTLKTEDVVLINQLKKLIEQKSRMSVEEFSESLYNIPKMSSGTRDQNIERQALFFQNIYELLFSKKSGPRLGSFLYDVDSSHILELLDV